MENFESIINLALYFIGIGIVVWIWFSLGLNVSKMKERFRLNRQIKLENYTTRWLHYEWMKQYHFLLASSIKKYEMEHFAKVVTTQFFVFIITLIILCVSLTDIVFSLGFALVCIYIGPISFLYIIHKNKQSYLQNELVESSMILLQEYEKNHKHMLFALKELVDHLDGPSKIAYAKLLSRMHGEYSVKELAAESFAFQIGHFRGKNLATIIFRACAEGVNVTTLLEDLITDITEFNKRIREAETESRETALIGYAPLPLLVILFFVNERWLIPGGNAAYYQFQTEDGLKSFLIAVVFGLIGLVLALVVKKPKKM
ncbi:MULTISPECIES: hypothetical protein [Cytobacillus]|uniref:Tight adherence protein B n=1 Tax=Cytobacillus oceanisediminis TaxID=665099 RepID=A0ABX3CMG5_9BACI|nr:hypothetical protein [Cytobacillus oceanisediminis]EFV75042.1 hypothetical protein HMPREF1013_04687 [Bacillus sp. 2_A_57_CT2]MCM3402993.1 hypothetical protein [Cytobacillus oceanisediminis]OHX44589.1 hypothetical protein BBV17_25535 [Cytobacillus oceanisediminis]